MKKTGIIVLIVVLVLLVIMLVRILVATTMGVNTNMFIGGFGKMEKIEQNIKKDEKVELSNIKDISLEFTSSDINIILTEDEQLRVVQYANTQLGADQLFYANKQNESVHIVEGNKNILFKFNLFNWYRIAYDIYLPKSYVENLTIKSASGDLTMDQELMVKNLKVELVSGEVKMPSSVKAETIWIKTVSGEIKLGKLESKDIQVESTSGEIEIIQAQGESNIKTVSGNISIDTIIGNITAKSTSGNINSNNFTVQGDSNMQSTSGNIRVYLNPESNCEIKTKTTSGSTKIPNDSHIIGNSPYSILNMKTTSGNIKVEIVTR